MRGANVGSSREANWAVVYVQILGIQNKNEFQQEEKELPDK
jgi:hypothetical protein